MTSGRPRPYLPNVKRPTLTPPLAPSSFNPLDLILLGYVWEGQAMLRFSQLFDIGCLWDRRPVTKIPSFRKNAYLDNVILRFHHISNLIDNFFTVSLGMLKQN